MKITWILWGLFIVLLILIFPKPCGSKVPSKVLIYECVGFETPLIGYLQKQEYREDWCSGICTSKKISSEKNNSESAADKQELIGGGPIGGISENIVKVVPVLLLMMGIIFVANFIKDIQAKAKSGGSMTIIRND